MDSRANIAPSTAGMTTKVVKGSIWTLAGQVLPLAVSLAVTPFTIRLLGPDKYGLLMFLMLVNTFLAFLDFGMSMAAIKLGSQAYAEGDLEKEKKIITSAAKIALIISVSAVTILMLLSGTLISYLNIASELQNEAVISFRLALLTLLFTIIYSVIYAPQIIRLRLDIATAINSGMRILGLIATPIVIYLGFGVVGAMTVLLIASILTLIIHLIVSSRFLPGLFKSRDTVSRYPELFRFGGTMVFASIGNLLMLNSEKAILPYIQPVENLAFYSVAFTLASMCTLLGMAITNTMIPALSQLLRPEKFSELQELYYRGMIIMLALSIPVFAGLFIASETFFTYWGGTEYAENSTIPFYILLLGLIVILPSNLPFSLLISTGRADLLAKLYWIEIIPYLALVYFLTINYGIIGTAAAWSLRAIWAGIIYFMMAHRKNAFVDGQTLRIFRSGSKWFVVIAIIYLPLIGLKLFSTISLPIILITYMALTAISCKIVYSFILSDIERRWSLSPFTKILSLVN